MKKGKYLNSAFLFLLAFAVPTSAQVWDIPSNLKQASVEFFKLADQLKPKTCSEMIPQIYKQLYELPLVSKASGGAEYNFYFGAHPDSSDVLDSLSTIFSARVKLQERFRQDIADKAFKNRAELEDCATNVRIAMRTLRTWEDLWGLWYLYKDRKIDYAEETSQTPPSFTQSQPYLKVNPKYASQGWDFKKSLRSGDLLLSRGTTFTGSVISRIGAIDNQFSHLAMVYIDETGHINYFDEQQKKLVQNTQKGRKFVVESVLNNGLQIIPLDGYLKHDYARIAAYRYGDSMSADSFAETQSAKIAARAAELMAQKAATGKVCYNFTMDMAYQYPNDSECPEKLFCSQSIAVGLKLACEEFDCTAIDKYSDKDNPYAFPLFLTKFNVDSNPVAQLLGLQVEKTFAPADVEIDPRIELMAEWTDYHRIPEARRWDMALTKMFQWMEVGGYSLKQNEAFKSLASIGDQLVKRMGKMPSNTPRGFIEATLMVGYLLEWTGPGEQVGGLVASAFTQDQIVDQLLQKMIQLLDDGTGMTLDLASVKRQYAQEIKDIFPLIETAMNHVGFKSRIERAEALRFKQLALQTLSREKPSVAAQYKDLNKVSLQKLVSNINNLDFGYFFTDYDIDKLMEIHRSIDCARATQKVPSHWSHLAPEQLKRLMEGPVYYHGLMTTNSAHGEICDPEIQHWSDLW